MRGAKSDRKERLISYALCGPIAAIVLFKLVSYRSSEPLMFGRYSLPYFLFLVLAAGATLFLVFLFRHFQFKAVYFILAIVLGFAILSSTCIALIEVAGQIYAFFHPSYRVLSLQPDRMLGWKLVPNLRFTWAGHHWYTREFSVPIETNSYGFRDIERTLAKRPGTIRVALLGDSMVEALQVPFDKTAGHLLERKLNARAQSGTVKPAQYEVLNFGVSNYGVGQYLLAWEQYASKFAPNYVFIIVAEIHMERTVRKYEPSAFSRTTRQLWVRPTFNLTGGKLVRESARDFDEFVNAQNEVIRDELGGRRIARRPPGLFVGSVLNFSPWQRLMHIQRRFAGDSKDLAARSQDMVFHAVDQKTVDTNLRVVEELGSEIKKGGGQLIVVDASRYFPVLRWKSLTKTLQRFCNEKGFGWIPLGDELLRAETNGIVTRWPYDQHFNETGNEMFAEAMYRWVAGRSETD